MHDATAPLDGSKVGFGRGRLAVKLVLGEARMVQRLLGNGIGEDVIRKRLERGKKAYTFALAIVKRLRCVSAGMIMA